ncbi:uncharacterized protein LOC119073024 [Bradysia coprophila]|uniref:uncharacterized protein LOC119073024 n=1 Tax=Bradysia coprophila TaxID=38358 RepID=UPI00187D9E26|nr:uncharacterized protein LOC119073024 [Bradysia coprophila]
MYSVIKSEKPICGTKIKSIPNVWFRGKNVEKLFVFPENLSSKQFLNAVRNSFQPTSSWKTYRCEILESKFKTYELAKAAEDRIRKNLEVPNVPDSSSSTRIQPTVGENPSQQMANFDAAEMEKIISEKVASAIQKHFEDLQANHGKDAINEDIEKQVQSSDERYKEAANTTYVVASVNDVLFEIQAMQVQEIDIIDFDDSVLPVKEQGALENFDTVLAKNIDHYRPRYQNRGAEKLSTSMRIIGNEIICDNYLRQFSYGGRGQNENFSKYKNVCDLICFSTMDAFNQFNNENITLAEVETYFRTNYIRLANQRYQRSLKKQK